MAGTKTPSRERESVSPVAHCHTDNGELRPPPPMQSRWRRLAARGLGTSLKAVAGLGVFYVVGINIFLSTRLFEKVIDGAPDTVDIHFKRGWSVIPGRIHARGLSIRGRDSNIDWILRLDEAQFDMSFLALVKQRFDVSSVHGKGISFRVRARLDAPPLTPEVTANLPPIEGFGTFSVHPPKIVTPDVWSDAAYHLWTAHLENVFAEDVREVWINGVRFQGHANIAGRFYFKPIRKVDLGPLHIDVHDGGVGLGPVALVEGLGGTQVDVRVAPFDPRTVDMTQLLHHTSLKLDARGSCPDIAAFHLTPAEGMTIEGPAIVEAVALTVENGAITGEGHLEATSPRLSVVLGEHHMTGALSAKATVAPKEGHERAELQVVTMALTVANASRARSTDGDLLEAERAVVTFDSSSLDFAHPFDDLHVVAELPEGTCGDVRALESVIPAKAPLALLGGRARAEGRVEAWLTDKHANARVNLHTDELDAELAKVRVHTTMAAEASVSAWRWEARRLEDARITLDVADGLIAPKGSTSVPFASMSGLRIDAQATVADLDDPMRAFSLVVAMPEGRPAAYLKASLPKGLAAQIPLAHFSATTDLEVEDGVGRGTFDVRSKGLRLGYGGLEIVADLGANARVGDWRSLGGDLSLEDVSLEVSDVGLRRRGRTGTAAPALTIGRLSLHATSPRFVVADPLRDMTLDATVRKGRVDDASALRMPEQSETTASLLAEAGTFSGRLHMAVAGHVARGRVALRAGHMGIAGSSFRFLGDTTASADVSDWHLNDGTMTLGEVRAAVLDLKGGVGGGSGFDLGADRVEVWGRAPKLDLLQPSLKGIDLRVIVANGAMPNASSLQALLPASSAMKIESGVLRLTADAELLASEGKAAGYVEFDLAGAKGLLHAARLRGDAHAIVHVQGFDSAQGSLDLSGSTIDLKNVDIANASVNASDWQGAVALSKGSLRLAPPAIEATLNLEANDASPLLSALFPSGLPELAAGMTRATNLVGSTRLTVGADGFALRDLDAHGDGLGVRGAFVSRGEHHLGAFAVRMGLLSVGVELPDTGGPGLRFSGLDGWLRELAAREAQLFGAR